MKNLTSLIVLLLLIISGCKKDPTLAVLTTSTVKDITINSVTSGGEITNGGGADITERGVCWSTSQNPVIAGTHTSDGKGTGSFSSTITGLTPNTKYYLRAYATNSAGTAYGNEISSTTTALVIPTLSTVIVSDIGFTTAASGGTITSDGNDPITVKGVCWSLTSNPTIDDSKTSNGAGSENFTSYLTVLTPGTTYHIRAYATNSVGTAYGNDLVFATPALAVPVLTTSDIGSISYTSAASGGTITSNGGSDITDRGVCWSTSANPTISNSKTTNGPGTGVFFSNLSGLLPGTVYYVRAYATNGVGTGYGNSITFSTNQIAPPTVTTKAITSVSYFSAVSGGDISNAGGGTITAKGVCWSVNSNPTTNDTHTTNGTGTDNFASNLTALTQATTYHVRAYATNSAGTSYGSDISFTTAAVAPATLSTTAVSLITAISARSGGNVTNAGGGNILARGVCWSTSVNPTIANSKSTNGTGTGTFASDMPGLVSGTVYHVRAYATNEAGTAYGNDIPFTTLTIQLPVVTTGSVSGIKALTAISGGNVTDDGNGTITARGVCWSVSPGPVASGSHTTDATGTGSFISNISGLTGKTTYYLRAYATNGAGTAYGSEVTFITFAATDADGNNYNSVTIGAQTWMDENLKTTKYNNGDLIGTTSSMNLDITAETSPKYQWPCGGSETYVATYGRFYTYYAVTDSRGVCPTGWHMPSDSDWESLKDYLGGENVSGGKLKEAGLTHWMTPNTGATNETGFTGLPGGYRAIDGNFVSITVTGYFWSSTLDSSNSDWALGQGLRWDSAIMIKGGYFKNDGASVRCLKD